MGWPPPHTRGPNKIHWIAMTLLYQVIQMSADTDGQAANGICQL